MPVPRIYRWLDIGPARHSYALKFLILAFVGIHIPLIAVIFFFVLTYTPMESALSILLVLLSATLVSTVVTLILQRQLLEPIRFTATSLKRYSENRSLPHFPSQYEDDAGQLMHESQHALERLEKMIRVRDEYLASLSHDLRTPLAMLGIACQMLQQEHIYKDENARRRYLHTMQRNIDTQGSFLNNLLLAARFDLGDLNLEQERIALRSVLEHIQQVTSLAQELREVQVRLDLPEEDEILADYARLAQVFSNLVANAIDHSAQGSEIVIRGRRESGAWVFSVADQGRGIPAEIQATLFERFIASAQGGGRQSKERGLGLWIVKTLVEAHGGSIRVESRLGVGSTFHFDIPQPS